MKIRIEKMSKQEATEKYHIENWGTWECAPSSFDWKYEEEEMAYVFEGKVTVKTEWESVTIESGDFVVFPKGLECHWTVQKPIKKVFTFC